MPLTMGSVLQRTSLHVVEVFTGWMESPSLFVRGDKAVTHNLTKICLSIRTHGGRDDSMNGYVLFIRNM